MTSRPRFLQGLYPYEGQGLDAPVKIDALEYVVPRGNESQLVYFRGGNSGDELVYAVILRDGEPMRYFPMGARAGTHVSLRVVEDLLADTRVEVGIAAPAGEAGHVIIDIGLVEV